MVLDPRLGMAPFVSSLWLTQEMLQQARHLPLPDSCPIPACSKGILVQLPICPGASQRDSRLQCLAWAVWFGPWVPASR